MGQRLDLTRAQGRFRSLVGSAVSGKGVLVQAIACQIALPAMAAQPSPGIAAVNITPNITPQAPDGDIYLSAASEEYSFETAAELQTGQAEPSQEIAPVQPYLGNELESPAISLIPLSEPTSAASYSLLPLTEGPAPVEFSPHELHIESATGPMAEPLLLAGPQDFNPGLSSPSDALPSTLPSHPPTQQTVPINLSPATLPAIDPVIDPVIDLQNQSSPEHQNSLPFIHWTDLEVGFDSDFDRSGETGQSRWSITPEVRGQLANGNTIGISADFSQFEQANIETVEHFPITFSWQGDLDPVELDISGGVDLFNRLPSDLHFSTKASIPIGSQAQLSMSVEQAPYAFNATTLENNISAWHYGPDLFWQISPKLSLFSEVRLGNYSDGNWEQQSFSRLERQVGEGASVALNLYNQSFQQNLEETSGYFSPRDFLVATAEMSWQEDLTEDLSCGLLGSIGQQRVAGEWALAYSAQALFRVDISPSIQLDLGYQFSNVSKNQSALANDNAYASQQIMGGISIRF
jgi:hypothetical protein